jgi:hypothetical protein
MDGIDGIVAAIVAALVVWWVLKKIFFTPLPSRPTGINPEARIHTSPHTKRPRQ